MGAAGDLECSRDNRCRTSARLARWHSPRRLTLPRHIYPARPRAQAPHPAAQQARARIQHKAMSQDSSARLRRRPGRASWPVRGISGALRALPPLSFAQAGTHFRAPSTSSASSAYTSEASASEDSSDGDSHEGSGDDEAEPCVFAAEGDASPPRSPHGRRTPELPLPDSPLRSFRARPPSHRKRLSQIHVVTSMPPKMDNTSAAAAPAGKPAEETSSPISPTDDWKNFVQLFKTARTSLGPTDAISAALNSPTRRPVSTTHSRRSSQTTVDDEEDSESSVDEDHEREETLRKAEEYFFSERPYEEGQPTDMT
ncbi:hypothetical protein PsYK624_108160 [Phanerochaete sordida]|uniref:Uncharacterized protein n=1 Tax=Phanerochaete sordida TaxID=48140 RepID=A0A9P3LGT4_9APHY|nr:hypothetical protein PsYK624_108160 [Phanerochaete sordida]